MAAQKGLYITLESVIQDFLGEAEYSVHRYFKVWHQAFRGFENMGIDFYYLVKSVKLPVNENFTVNMPADCLNWTKVGILNDRGEIIPLYHNNKFTTYADLFPDRVEKTQDPESAWLEWNSNTWVNFWNGSFYTNVYGVPSGEPFVGSFKIDNENGLIILDQTFNRDYIMLEYVASPKEGEEYYLPVQFREALIAWLWWKDSKASNVRRGRIGIIRDLKNDFYRERRNAMAQWKQIKVSEKYQTSQELSRLAVKT